MFRVGHGYDLHKLVLNRPLILCAERIPFEKGLLGHSDADVATHAIIDSLFGAAALYDIGHHFPDTEEKYKNISSLKLLNITADILKNHNFKISNIDLTIVAQAPKLSPYIDSMKNNIANTINLNINQINIKATTEEGVGLTGSKNAIAAFCCSLIYPTN